MVWLYFRTGTRIMSNFTKLMAQAAAGAAGSGGFYDYEIDYSARFNDDDAAYLYRTPSSATNQIKWTYSVWVKRANLSAGSHIFLSAYSPPYYFTYCGFENNSITFGNYNLISPGWIDFVQSTDVMRDSSAWYHLVWVYDSANATTSNRVKLYVNNKLITSFLSANYPTSSYAGWINNTVEHSVGSLNFNGSRQGYVDSYMSQVAFVDGQALDPTSFGENKNGVWIPKDVSGLTFGTNGYYLDFADSSNLGNDVSGNNNDFTSSGLTSSDQMTDTPTNNYPTLQTYNFSAPNVTTYSNGNLEAYQDSGAFKHTRATFGLPTTGKWYWEVQFIDARTNDPPLTAFGIGVSDADGLTEGYSTGAVISIVPGSTTTYSYEDGSYTAADNITLSNAVVDGDWFGIAYDADTRKMWLWSERDNTWFASGDPANGTNPWKTLTALSASQTYFPIALTQTNDSGRWSKFGVNFGQYAFVGSAPTDFLELKAANLPEPTIGPNSATQSDENFNAIAYTGSGSQSVTGVGFQPDLVWVKGRSVAYNHQLHDAVRGATAGVLSSNSTNAENAAYSFDSFDSDGFTTDSANITGINNTGQTFVAWNWKANGSGVTNTDGTLTATVSANQDAGISIITAGYGNGTFGHELGRKPDVMIWKERSPNANDWYITHPGLSSVNHYIVLNSTAAEINAGSDLFGLTATTAGKDNGLTGRTGVAYCFAEVEGFSKFGSYTGNGSADGPFIYTGFRPAFVLVKSSTYTGTLWLTSADPNGYNVVDTYLAADSSNAEYSPYTWIDYLSNGFKLRQTGDSLNRSGQTYIFMAFAENPFKYSNAR